MLLLTALADYQRSQFIFKLMCELDVELVLLVTYPRSGKIWYSQLLCILYKVYCIKCKEFQAWDGPCIHDKTLSVVNRLGSDQCNHDSLAKKWIVDVQYADAARNTSMTALIPITSYTQNVFKDILQELLATASLGEGNPSSMTEGYQYQGEAYTTSSQQQVVLSQSSRSNHNYNIVLCIKQDGGRKST